MEKYGRGAYPAALPATMKQTADTKRKEIMRGCERRIYHVRSADSPCFEEAYLILRRRERRAGDPLQEAERAVPGEKAGRGEESRTMAEEAERIIRESSRRYLRERRQAPIHRLSPPLAFALGAGTSSLLIGAAVLVGVLL